MALKAPVPLMTFHGPLSVRPFDVRGSNPIRRVPSGHLMFLSSQLSSRLPCPPLHVPPGQKGAPPSVDPVRILPVSTFPSSFASVLIRIFWRTGATPGERALPAVWVPDAGVSPSPQAARPAPVTANARISCPDRRGCLGTLPDISSIETPSSSPLAAQPTPLPSDLRESRLRQAPRYASIPRMRRRLPHRGRSR